MTAAAAGEIGKVRRDPFAMLPFCGYHMGDYFAHWIEIGKTADAAKLPQIFAVNWFRKDAADKFLWPGFGENSRVLKWIFERVEGTAAGKETPVGVVPAAGELDLSGLDLPDEMLQELLSVDAALWKQEVAGIAEYYTQFGDHLPAELQTELETLQQRLST